MNIVKRNLTVEDIRSMSWLVKVQPMTEQQFDFYGNLVESNGGYWYYMSNRYDNLDDILNIYLNSKEVIMRL
jgi:hypothetical protein